jgi:hypothetical protein
MRPALAPFSRVFFRPHGGDAASYGARRLTDALRYSQVRELAAADNRLLIDANMLGRSNA